MIQKSFTVQLSKGLHARPSATIVSHLKKMQLDSVVIECGRRADCKNVLSLLSLAIACREKVTVFVSGRDEQEAIAFFEKFFSCDESEFYEKFSIQ